MDNEIKGEGNSLNYKYRMHDPRVGRFFAVDPLEKEFPWNSPYAFSENRVLDKNELEGLETGEPVVTKVLFENAPFLLPFVAEDAKAAILRHALIEKTGLSTPVSQEVKRSTFGHAKGAVGEGLFAGSALTGFLPFYRAIPTPAPRGVQYDVVVRLTPIPAVFKRARKGLEIRLGKSYIRFTVDDAGLKLYNADGITNYRKKLSETLPTKIYAEVKSVKGGRTGFAHLKKGLDQAIKTAEKLKIKPNSVSVLVFDKEVYRSIIKNPTRAAEVQTKLLKLQSLGGGLLLKENLSENAETITQFISDKVGEELPTPSPPKTKN